MHELVTKAASGEVQAADVMLNELIDCWLELGGPPEASTRVTYKGYIRNHVAGGIGRLKLSRLRAEDLDRRYSRLKAKSLAPAPIRKCHVIVSGALSQGRRWGWVVANVPSWPHPRACRSRWCAPLSLTRSAGCLQPRPRWTPSSPSTSG